MKYNWPLDTSLRGETCADSSIMRNGWGRAISAIKSKTADLFVDHSYSRVHHLHRLFRPVTHLLTMTLERCKSHGVPTTPVPRMAAPSPRYNDVTRPSSLRMDADGARQTLSGVGDHFWVASPSGSEELVSSTVESFVAMHRSANSARSQRTHNAGHARSSWWDSTSVPEPDEQIVTSAREWVTGVLRGNGGAARGTLDGTNECIRDVIGIGHTLCRLIEVISPGRMDFAHSRGSSGCNATDMNDFLTACSNLGVPEGVLFDANERDPTRIALCLHALSRVARETIPTFPGPFLVWPTLTSPRGHDENNNTLRSQSSRRLIGEGSRNHFHTALRTQHFGQHKPNLMEIDTARYRRHASRRPRQEDAAARSRHHEAIAIGPSSPHPARCPPPPYAAPSPAEHPRNFAWTPTGGTAVNFARFTSVREQLPFSDTARTRKLSEPVVHLPSRLFPSSPDADATWDSFHPPNPEDAASGNSSDCSNGSDCTNGHDIAGRGGRLAASCAAASFPARGPSASAADTMNLSSWLEDLNLGSFEEALAIIGVEVMTDLRYVEEEDLSAIGMHGPQVRKFMQSRP